jgi:hypothetical protein
MTVNELRNLETEVNSPEQVSGILTQIRADHTDAEIMVLAKDFTGRAGRSVKTALEYIRVDLSAVYAVLESQKI